MTTLMIFTCPICGKFHTVAPLISELIAYEDGAPVQNAFKSLNATEREQIISHLCPKCQADLFGSDEDYDEPADLEMGFDPYEGCYIFDC